MQPPTDEGPAQGSLPFIVDQLQRRAAAGRPARLRPATVAALARQLRAAEEEFDDLLSKAFAALDTLNEQIEDAIDAAREQVGTLDHDDPEAEVVEALDDLALEVRYAIRAAREELCP
jgi:hypothetical protein